MNLEAYIKNHQVFVERIFNEIQKLPFGSLPKNELELLILDAIIRSIEPLHPYTNIEKHFNELKTTLKLSQTQLRNKILAAQLRYDKITDLDVERSILTALANKNYTIENSYIVIPIFNPLLNDQVKSYFEVKHIITDTSFNKSIVKINLNGLIQFLLHSDTINESQKQSIHTILLELKEEGLISFSTENSLDATIDRIDKVTSIGVSLLTLIEKIAPVITNLIL
jgi:hypothetical protein